MTWPCWCNLQLLLVVNAVLYVSDSAALNTVGGSVLCVTAAHTAVIIMINVFGITFAETAATRGRLQVPPGRSSPARLVTPHATLTH
jgi:hypothetical protein